MLTFFIILTLVSFLVGTAGGLIARYNRRFSDLTFLMVLCGFAIGMIGIAGIILAAGTQVHKDRIAALETRYDITIEKAKFSETPRPWLIDGEWRTCYIPDLSAADNNDALELLCSDETVKYAHP